MVSVNVCYDLFGRIVQNLGMGKQTAVILKEGGIVVAVADPLVQHEFYIDILLLHHRAVFQNLQSPAFAAESAKTGEVAEVIQVGR